MHRRQATTLLCSGILTAGSAGCLGVVEIEVQPHEIVFITLDAKETLKPIPKDKSGKLVAAAIRDLKWSSTAPDVVKVDTVGVITSAGYGEAEVHVTAGGQTGVTKVRVAKPAKVTIEPDEIELVGAGKTQKLSAKVFDDKGVEIPTHVIVWATKNTNITVESGEVKSINVGEAKVTAKCGDAIGEAKVTVKYPPVAKLVAAEPAIDMEVGESAVMPIIGYDKEEKPLPLIPAKFKSSKPNIVTIDESGVLIAVKKGAAKVIATADGHSAEVSVHVH